MATPSPGSDDLLRSLDETHTRLEQQFLGQAVASVADPSIPADPPPLEDLGSQPARPDASTEWHTLVAQGTTTVPEAEVRDSLATVSLASVGEQLSAGSHYSTDLADGYDAGMHTDNSAEEVPRVRATLRRDSGGLFRMVLKRDEAGDVYIGALPPSDAADERAYLCAGEYIRSIDGVTAADVGFHGLQQHVKSALQSIVLEVERTEPLWPLGSSAAALAEALGRFGIGEAAAAEMAMAATEREGVLGKVGIDARAVAELATEIHRKGEEVKQGWSALGEWWREKSEAAGSGLASFVQAAAPNLRETTEDMGHTLQQIGGELQTHADQLLKRATGPAPGSHQTQRYSGSPPPPPPPPPARPLCSGWATGGFSASASSPGGAPPEAGAVSADVATARAVAARAAAVSEAAARLVHGAPWSTAAGPYAAAVPVGASPHAVAHGSAPPGAPPSSRISSFGWGEPRIEPELGFEPRHPDQLRLLGNYSEWQLRQMGEDEIVELVLRESAAEASQLRGGTALAAGAGAPPVVACGSHDAPPIVVEVD